MAKEFSGIGAYFLFFRAYWVRREVQEMEKEKCILCGQPTAAGLQVMGCTICFPCERRLLMDTMPQPVRRKLKQIYASAHLEG